MLAALVAHVGVNLMSTLLKGLIGSANGDGYTLDGSSALGFGGGDLPAISGFGSGGLWSNVGSNGFAGFGIGQTASIGDLGLTSMVGGAFGSGFTAPVQAAAAPSPTVVTTAGSGLTIHLVWDSSVSSAPAGFMTDVIAAAHYLETNITTTATINFQVGYGEVAGSSLGNNALGESQTNIVSVSYSQLLAALQAKSSGDATDAAFLASLPATSPVSGNYWVTAAQAKALGLSAANGTSTDGAIGFATSSLFTYGDTNTTGAVSSGTYDFFATATHEMTEVMGRLLLVGQSINGAPAYSAADLTHYSAAGVRDFTQSTAGYFSPDGGVTNLDNFNTISGGDAGDWAASAGNDSFDAYANPGVLEPVSAADLALMDAIGWNGPGSVGPPRPAADHPADGRNGHRVDRGAGLDPDHQRPRGQQGAGQHRPGRRPQRRFVHLHPRRRRRVVLHPDLIGRPVDRIEHGDRRGERPGPCPDGDGQRHHRQRVVDGLPDARGGG